MVMMPDSSNVCVRHACRGCIKVSQRPPCGEAGASIGGCLQLLLELQFLEAALPAYAGQAAIEELLAHATDILVSVIEVRICLRVHMHTSREWSTPFHGPWTLDPNLGCAD